MGIVFEHRDRERPRGAAVALKQSTDLALDGPTVQSLGALVDTLTDPGLVAEAMAWIGALYRIEASVRERPPDEKLTVRQAQSVPLLERFRRWLEGHFPSLLPKSPLGQAFGYALRHWRALVRHTESEVLVPD